MSIQPTRDMTAKPCYILLYSDMYEGNIELLIINRKSTHFQAHHIYKYIKTFCSDLSAPTSTTFLGTTSVKGGTLGTTSVLERTILPSRYRMTEMSSPVYYTES